MSCSLNKMALGKLAGRGAGWAEGGILGWCLVMSICAGFPWGLVFFLKLIAALDHVNDVDEAACVTKTSKIILWGIYCAGNGVE